MHPADLEIVNHLGQWVAIIGGGVAVWATMRRMRTNELRHLEETMKAECKDLSDQITSVWEVVNKTRDRVSRLEGWRNGLKGTSPGGK